MKYGHLEILKSIIADGYTDCSSALNLAIMTIPSIGGVISLPPGKFLLKSKVVVSKSNIKIIGAGRGLTNIIIEDPDGVGFLMHNEQMQLSRLEISDLTLNATRTQSQGSGVSIRNCVDVRISNSLVANLHCGVEIIDSSFVYITDVEIVDPAPKIGAGVVIKGDGIHNDQYLTRVFVQSRRHIECCRVGFQVTNTQGVWISDCGAFHCGVGIHISAENTRTLEHVFMSNNAFDTSKTDGIMITAEPGSTVRRVQSIGDWSSSNGSNGLNITAGDGVVDDIKFIGLRVLGNNDNGVNVDGVQSLYIDNASIAGNGSNGGASGISIIGECDTVAIRSCTIGSHSGFENTQEYGIDGIQYIRYPMIVNNIFDANKSKSMRLDNEGVKFPCNLYK